MRNILKSLVFNFIALFAAAQLIDGFSYGGDITVLVFAALVLGVVNVCFKPVLKAVTIPLNLMTLGLFSMAIDAALLYLVARLVSGLSFTAFRFNGFQLHDVVIPSVDIPVTGTFIVTAIIVSIFVVSLETIFGDE